MECVFTTQNFDTDVLRSEMPVLVDFYADWCGPCKMMAPTVEELAADFAGKAKVGKLNVDQNPEIAERYGIMSIPTLLIIRGGDVFYKAIGVQSKQVIADALNKALM
ncbi:MAG TPA: thioredoxin [Candidatus Lachnoclostridium avicola]|nr:thioredoxin [Candidatus Lachnoclostridium avicola]